MKHPKAIVSMSVIVFFLFRRRAGSVSHDTCTKSDGQAETLLEGGLIQSMSERDWRGLRSRAALDKVSLDYLLNRMTI